MAGFNDIYGQDAVKEFMQKALAAGQIPHACILSGEKSSGKEFIAGIFARALQCENGGPQPCEKCRSCLHPRLPFAVLFGIILSFIRRRLGAVRI